LNIQEIPYDIGNETTTKMLNVYNNICRLFLMKKNDVGSTLLKKVFSLIENITLKGKERIGKM